MPMIPLDSGDGQSDKDVRRRVNAALDGADRAIERASDGTGVAERLALAAKSSELLSSVWTLPPAQRVMFHPGDRLVDIPADGTPGFPAGKAEGQRFIDLSSGEISRFMGLMYANGVRGSHRRLLIILQGMDTSGKGGIVRHVFRQGDPMGIHYHGFGAPSEEELRHDFLWRIKRELPRDGWVAVFDRSHYEDIIMPRVYGTQPESVWRERYDIVNDFERSLVADGCSVIKIFLTINRDFQRGRFLDRLDDPTKRWKFDVSDLDARERWDDYMQAWQEVFERTSTSFAPWYIVPANKRWYSRAVVSELLRTTFTTMNLTWPALSCDEDEARARLSL